MVSLRGSKFGSRVAMLCCNPNHVTRPGPGAGMQISRYGNPSDNRFGNNDNRYGNSNESRYGSPNDDRVPMGMSGGRLGGRGSSYFPPFR